MIADLKSTINFCLEKVITKKSLKIKNFDRCVPLSLPQFALWKSHQGIGRLMANGNMVERGKYERGTMLRSWKGV